MRAKNWQKFWMIFIWGPGVLNDVWRVELQLGRKLLKEFSINGIDDLIANASALWRYGTCDWLSLRLKDDSNASRRTTNPWWAAVQECADLFGPHSDMTRQRNIPAASDVDFYVKRIASLVPGFGARLQITDLSDALDELRDYIRQHWEDRQYDDNN